MIGSARRNGKGAGRGRAWMLALAGAMALAACGGSTSAIEPFEAGRVLAFGDEASVLTPAGHKYGVNVLDDDDALECASQPIWVQAVANLYDIVFAECNPDNVAAPAGRIFAKEGDTADDLEAQIDALEQAGGVQDKDLATVLVGANDVLELYDRFPTVGEADLIAELRQRGDRAAAQVNRLVDLGARVILSTAPDVGKSPFALAEKAAHTDTDRAALLTRMVAAFNLRLRVGIINDGRLIGLVLADEMVQAMVKSPGSFSLTNVTGAVCLDTAALPDCTTDTLVAGYDPARGVGGWLWADATRMAFGGQQRLGLLAQSRARNNPF